MVLFALGAEIGVLSAKEFAPLLTTPKRLNDQLDKDKRSLLEALDKAADVHSRALFTGLTADKLDLSSFGKSNPFTLAWLLTFVNGVALHRPVLQAELKKAVGFSTILGAAIEAAVKRLSTLYSAAPKLLDVSGAEMAAAIHGFPALRALQLHQLAKSLRSAVNSVEPLSAEPSIVAAAKITPEEMQAIGTWFLSRVLDNLAFATIRDAPFDAAELAFSLEGYLLCQIDLEDGRHHDPDIVKRAFSVLSERQEINPYWRPLKPLVTTKRGFALLPLSVEIVNSLFRTCWLLKARGEAIFAEHVEVFRRYFEWIESRTTHGKFTKEDGSEAEFLGWHSEHVQKPGSIHVWETSQVAIFLLHYRDMRQRHLAKRALRAARLKPRTIARKKKASRSLTPAAYWTAHVLKNDPAPPSNTLYSSLCKQLLESRESASSQRPSFSMVLYGPPGTGKTSIAEQLAAALNWTFVEITPSDFVASGESAVERRASEIFYALAEQQDMVILLDEIDRLILDRDSMLYAKQGDMFQSVTPGMLPKLKALRSAQRSIFILGTNFKERLDPAAIRLGRVDKQFLVGLPNSVARAAIICSELNDELTAGAISIRNADKKTATEIVNGDLISISDQCVLGAYGELCEVVRAAIAAMRDSDKIYRNGADDVAVKDEVLSALDAEAKNFVSAVRLDGYRPRFSAFLEGTDELPTKEEPIDEFIDLAALACETDVTRKTLGKSNRETISSIITELCTKNDILLPDDAQGIQIAKAIKELVKRPGYRDRVRTLKSVATAMEDASWDK